MEARLARQLTLKQLRLVAAIAEHRHLSMAAQALLLSQPAASRSLAEIEQLCGGALFARHPRGMEATAMGEILARRARNVVAETETAARELAQFRSGRGGTIRIGAVTGGALAYAVPAVHRLAEASPRSTVHLEVGTSRELVRDLLALRLDLALARVPPDTDPTEFDIVYGAPEEIELAVGCSHPAAGNGPVDLAELVAYDWIMQSTGAPIRVAVEEALLANGRMICGRVTHTSSLLVTLAMLTDSRAVAPVSGEVARLLVGISGSHGVTVLRLTERIVVSPYSLLSLRDRRLSPAAQRCLELIRDMLTRTAAP